MTLVKRLEDAIEHHRIMCCALTVRAMDRETKGEGIREELSNADAKLLDTIIAALSEGEMVRVPREPTEEMLIRGSEAIDLAEDDGHNADNWKIEAREAYRAMISASPSVKEHGNVE